MKSLSCSRVSSAIMVIRAPRRYNERGLGPMQYTIVPSATHGFSAPGSLKEILNEDPLSSGRTEANSTPNLEISIRCTAS